MAFTDKIRKKRHAAVRDYTSHRSVPNSPAAQPESVKGQQAYNTLFLPSSEVGHSHSAVPVTELERGSCDARIYQQKGGL